MFDLEAVPPASGPRARRRRRPAADLVDAPGGSQVPLDVIEAVSRHYRRGMSNTHGAFATSEETDAVIGEARRAAADFTGADPDEIVFGPNATSLLLHVSRSFAKTWSRGTRSSSPGWTTMRTSDRGCSRPRTPAPPFDGWTSTRTTSRSTSRPSTPRCRRGRSSSRSRSRPTRSARSRRGRSGHPRESGGRRRRARRGPSRAAPSPRPPRARRRPARVLPVQVLRAAPRCPRGAAEDPASWSPYKLIPSSDDVPERWETGTQNHEGLAGLTAAVDYLAGLASVSGTGRRDRLAAAYEAIDAHERLLADRFLVGLASLPSVRCGASPTAIASVSGPPRSRSE